MNLLVLVRDRLITGGEIDDAQARMTQADTLIRGQPDALAVRTPVMEGFRGTFQPLR